MNLKKKIKLLKENVCFHFFKSIILVSIVLFFKWAPIYKFLECKF